MEIGAPKQPVSRGIPGEKSSGSDSPRETQPDISSPSGEGVDKLLPNGRSPPPHPMGEPADWIGEILPHQDGGFNLSLILVRVLPLKGGIRFPFENGATEG